MLPAFCIREASTERVDAGMVKPNPKVISLTTPTPFVPFRVEFDPGLILTFVMAEFEMIGAAAVVPGPPRSPASCTFPLTNVVASGVDPPNI